MKEDASRTVWRPSRVEIEATNLHAAMREIGARDYDELHAWSITRPEEFWAYTITALGITLHKSYERILDFSEGIAHTKWLPGAALNIATSCFQGNPDRPAIITRRYSGALETILLCELERLTNRVANGLCGLGLSPGDAIAVDLPMTAEAVAIYLGIVKSGCIVVSIPDSFPADQIAKRLSIGDAKAVFTQDRLLYAGKTLPLYRKVCEAQAPLTIVLATGGDEPLRSGDLAWRDFLSPNETFDAVICAPDAATNYIFSSGTTGDPKCIPWDHTTPIKAASDGRYHQDVRAGDVVCWPTNLGWMMGPWLVYASLLNQATMALYEGAPGERGFAEFVQNAKVTMLGLVPSIAASWRATGVANGFDWSAIRCFSSSGEASNAEVYGWLMSLNQKPGVLKPVVEYCGGTEVGGGYVSNRLDGELRPSQFNCQVMGIGFAVLNDEAKPCGPGEAGEVFITTPSIGLSTRLHKGDNEKVYYAGSLRRHGDRMICLEDGCYRSDGRSDNAMNLNGIKIGSTEIETVAAAASSDIAEVAAIGAPALGGGPDRLVIFAVPKTDVRAEALKDAMQRAISTKLNPQFRLHDVVLVDALPRTASHKVMHRTLRDRYLKS
jgi:acetyl-CoA synthetase